MTIFNGDQYILVKINIFDSKNISDVIKWYNYRNKCSERILLLNRICDYIVPNAIVLNKKKIIK